MKFAMLNGQVIDLTSTLKAFSQIRDEVQRFGAFCPVCQRSVYFRSGPIKGPHFVHKVRSDNCQHYHPSSIPKEEEKLPPYIVETISLFVPLLQRELTKKEKEQIQLWFHVDEYQLSEISGALKELTSESVPEQLFKRMDAKLYSITRGKNNPYFQRVSKKEAFL